MKKRLKLFFSRFSVQKFRIFGKLKPLIRMDEFLLMDLVQPTPSPLGMILAPFLIMYLGKLQKNIRSNLGHCPKRVGGCLLILLCVPTLKVTYAEFRIP
jgi:hypothetical protein